MQPGGRESQEPDEFGLLLRLRRKQAGLTQERLAERTGLGVRTIRDLERGQVSPRPATVRLLGDGLGLDGSARAQFVTAAHDSGRGRRRALPAAVTNPPDALVVPAQLPADLAGFTGRTQHLRELDALLTGSGRGEDNGQTPAVVISAIAGTAGVGKTALAVHWAHQVRDEFPDGQLYVNLRGFDPAGTAMPPAEAVRGFLDAFGVPPQRVPASLAAQAALYRSLLTGRRVLVMLDNARDVEQIRPLLPGSPGCLALVTSRYQLTSLVATQGAHLVTLDPLSTAEARELLARRLGVDRLSAEPHAVNQIIASCSWLPLALAIVAVRAATHPQFPLAALAAELREASGGLDAFDGGDAPIDVRTVFSWSYHALGAEAARVFRLLGLHPGPDVAPRAAASLACLPVGQTRRALAELTRAHLVAEHAPGRYSLHDLLRAYAAELAQTIDTGAERRAAVHRMLDHYLHAAHAGALLLDPHRRPIALAPPQPGVTSGAFDHREQALAWFAAEHPALLAAIRQAVSAGFDIHAWQLPWTLMDFFDRCGHWHDLAAIEGVAVDAARRLADRIGQAHAHRGLARACERLGRHDDARSHYLHALDLYEQLGDLRGQANIHACLGAVFEQERHHHDALHHDLQALNLFRAAGDRSGQARALNGIGWEHAQLGDYRQALGYCQQALTLLGEVGDLWVQAATCDSLGYIYRHLDDHHQAKAHYLQAVALWQEVGNRYYEADTLTHLGNSHQAAGNPDGARDAWQHALAILDQLDHPDANQVRAMLHELERSPAQAHVPTAT
jgi:tetratricopeptide (TPR) repeat protein/transcriptional regulator with XRE-family HTH domain